MQQKKFEGMEDFKVTDEVKILVSAAAVQLTFGLEDYSLNSHSLIRIFPTTFYNTRTGDEYKGLTLSRSLIALSWDDFEKGYLIDDDNFNLGLHELAHALRLSINTDDFDSRFAGDLDHWDEVAVKEFERMQSYPDENFLRSYAASNMSEFFPVCIEYFFEVPNKFSQQLPEIFNYLTILLNQDPLNLNNDYKLKETEEPYDATNVLNKDFFLFREWSAQVDSAIVIFFFAGLLGIWPLISHMKINFGTFCVNSGYAFFLMLLLTQLYRITFTMRRLDGIDIMRMILLAPFICTSIFAINYVTPIESKFETYSIDFIKVREINRLTDEAIIDFKNDELNSFVKLRTFETDSNTYEWDKVNYQFESGIFGYENLKSRTIILKNQKQILY